MVAVMTNHSRNVTLYNDAHAVLIQYFKGNCDISTLQVGIKLINIKVCISSDASILFTLMFS